ncbi:MAG TPA: sulfotransferase family 2 domain-containing protein [Anaerolineae bacterium]|nr:sulfotransferase family 2 domain-containing protein [Anaerolineae bacterium]
MIISHTYRYLFVQLPRTGSTAVAHELRQLYGGTPILRKHSTYEDFQKIATPEEKRYFVFSCIRNPLDDAVSHYFKCKTDHKGNFTKPQRLERRKGLVNQLDYEIFEYLRRTDADFATFFLKFYRTPYNNWASLSHRTFNYVMRFENLVADFATVLEQIGIEPKRPLPHINPTARRTRSYISYYDTPEVIARAKWVFGPFMQEWGYEFPPEWGEMQVPWWNRAQYSFLNVFRTMYWKHLRYRI